MLLQATDALRAAQSELTDADGDLLSRALRAMAQHLVKTSLHMTTATVEALRPVAPHTALSAAPRPGDNMLRRATHGGAPIMASMGMGMGMNAVAFE